MKAVCYYHKEDLDGIGSAAILKKYLEEGNFKDIKIEDTKFIGVMHGNMWKENDVKDAWVFVLDFSFPNMPELRKLAYSLVWCDHHESAKHKFPIMWYCFASVKGHRDIDKAAIQLTWDYCYPDKETPLAVKLIADRDTWKFEHEDTKPFNEAFKLYAQTLHDPHWNVLDVINNNKCQNFIEMGHALMIAKNVHTEMVFNNGKDVIFEKHKTRLMNSCKDVSDCGEYAYKNMKYPVAIIWSVRGSELICSLRSNTVDVGEIAVAHGGGGHKAAASFAMPVREGLSFIRELLRGYK